MSSIAILLIPALAASAFGIGIWLGIRSATGESAAESRQARCTEVLRSRPDIQTQPRPATWPESRRAR
ncbi:hypothetical protein ACIRRA_38740 [Nocardia sp. NPDC101769]|uniref:hypothetical protein n=1 Tax=Nocardia sp. NPDC101769 TaxID=3364333 RepID=UPI00381284F3